MGQLSLVLYLVLGLFLVWTLSRLVRANPQWFALDAVSQSLGVLGRLALALIALIALLVWSL